MYYQRRAHVKMRLNAISCTKGSTMLTLLQNHHKRSKTLLTVTSAAKP